MRLAFIAAILLSMATESSSRMSKSMSQHFKQFSDQLPEPVVKQAALPPECAAGYVPPTSSFDFWSLAGSPFNSSGYTTYITNVLSGLRLTYYFQYSTECTRAVQNLLTDVHLGNKEY